MWFHTDWKASVDELEHSEKRTCRLKSVCRWKKLQQQLIRWLSKIPREWNCIKLETPYLSGTCASHASETTKCMLGKKYDNHYYCTSSNLKVEKIGISNINAMCCSSQGNCPSKCVHLAGYIRENTGILMESDGMGYRELYTETKCLCKFKCVINDDWLRDMCAPNEMIWPWKLHSRRQSDYAIYYGVSMLLMIYSTKSHAGRSLK